MQQIHADLVQFSGNFEPNGFVENITKPLLRSASIDAKSNGRFDPSPFIRSFQSSIDNLGKLRKLAMRKIGDSEDSFLAAEKTYQSLLSNLASDHQSISDSFEKLENQISDVGRSALLIGEQLRSLERQRLRAQEARELVELFVEFNQSSTTKLDSIKNSDGWSGKSKAAQLCKRLGLISREAELPSTETARQSIENYCEAMERELLEAFDRAFRDRDIEGMATCARILFDFNGGQSCTQAYINQCVLFVSSGHIREQLDSPAVDNLSPLPDSLDEYRDIAPKLDMGFTRLIETVKQSLKSEWVTISTVFPNASSVMQQLIQRVFAQTIQTSVEVELRGADSRSALDFMRILAACHSEIFELVDYLKGFLLDSLKEPVAIQSMTVTLNRCREDTFVQFVDNDRYIEKELKCLIQATNLGFRPFNEFLALRKTASKNKGMFGKISNATAGAAPSTDYSVGYHNALLISLDLIGFMIEIFRDTVSRCREVAPAAEVPRYVQSVFNCFIDTVGVKYIDNSLEIVIENLMAMDPKAEPEYNFLAVISNTNDAVHRIQKFFLSVIVPELASQTSIHREVIVRKNNFVDSLETKINFILNKIISASIVWINGILSKQKKTDYKPKDSDMIMISNLSTSPCSQVREYLKKVHGQAAKYLDGQNIEMYMTELSVKFYASLLEHFKKFQFNTNGGLLLSKDLALYQQTVASFNIPGISDRFEILKQIGNIFVVKPENLKTLLEDSSLARLDPATLHVFVSNRTDYKSARLDTLFKGLVIEERNESSGNVWEKTFEGAVELVGETFEEMGQSIKKILVI